MKAKRAEMQRGLMCPWAEGPTGLLQCFSSASHGQLKCHA